MEVVKSSQESSMSTYHANQVKAPRINANQVHSDFGFLSPSERAGYAEWKANKINTGSKVSHT